MMALLREQIEIQRGIQRLFLQTLDRAVTTRWRWSEITQHIVNNGIGSLPVILVATAFSGLVVTDEIAWHMDHALHTVQMIPGFTGQIIFRELGIAIPAFLLISKVGASITAEVGTMKITDQIDALKLLGIDPVNYLVFPRFIASIISTACLTLLASGVTMACAIGMAVAHYDFSIQEYINALRHFVHFSDLACAMVKGTVFGAVIPIISCAYGFRCKGGAEGVGTATTDSVVASTTAVIVLDFIITFFFSRIL